MVDYFLIAKPLGKVIFSNLVKQGWKLAKT